MLFDALYSNLQPILRTHKSGQFVPVNLQPLRHQTYNPPERTVGPTAELSDGQTLAVRQTGRRVDGQTNTVTAL